jgi:hypothetical protein
MLRYVVMTHGTPNRPCLINSKVLRTLCENNESELLGVSKKFLGTMSSRPDVQQLNSPHRFLQNSRSAGSRAHGWAGKQSTCGGDIPQFPSIFNPGRKPPW